MNLRALACVAKQGDFEISIPSIQDYENDIKGIDGFIVAAERYFPEKYLNEAKEIGRNYTHNNNTFFNIDSPVNFILQRHVKEIGDTIDAVCERWTAAFVPKISIDIPATATNAEKVKIVTDAVAEHESDVKNAVGAVEVKDKSFEHSMAEYGKRRAESEKKSQAIVEQYKNK